jgi:hypothetical protein
MAYFTNLKGEPVTVPDDQVERATQYGFKVRQPTPLELAVEREKASPSLLRTAGEGFTRGASLGFAEPLLADGTENRTPEDLKARKLVNPGVAAVSDVVGNVGAAFLTGGGSVGAAVLGGGLKAAVVEGGLYGLGSLVSDTTLERKPITAEKAASYVIGGMLTGGVVHGGTKAVQGLASVTAEGLRSLGGGAMSKTLTELGGKAEWDLLREGAGKKWYQANEPLKEEILKKARELGVLGQTGRSLDEAALADVQKELQRAEAALLAKKNQPILLQREVKMTPWGEIGETGGAGVLPDTLASKPKLDIAALERDVAVASGLEKAIANHVSRPPKANNLVGLALAAATGNPLAVVGAGVASKLAKDKGGIFLGKALRDIGESGALEAIAGGLEKRVLTIMNSAPDFLGKFAGPLASAVSRGTGSLLETHVKLASGPDGKEYLSKLGLEPETSGATKAAGKKIAAYHEENSLSFKVDSAFDKALPGILNGTAPRTLPAPIDGNSVAERARAYVASPDAVFAQFPDHPEVAAAALRGASFLAAMAPKNPYSMVPEAVRPPWQPGYEDKQRFERMVHAVRDPIGVLELTGHGLLTQDHKDALKAVYPELFLEAQQKINEALSVWKPPISNSSRMKLQSVLSAEALGLDGSTGLQGLYAPRKKQNGNTGQGYNRSVEVDKNMQTQSQRLEER